MPREPFLQIKKITKSFTSGSDFNLLSKTKRQVLKNISLDIFAGESVGLVGESGSGKTTLGKCIIRLLKSDSGQVIYNDTNILEISKKEYLSLQSKFQMIFQHPDQALNPVHTIEKCLSEPLKVILKIEKNKINEKIEDLLDWIGLDETVLECVPNQLSGGQKKRVIIARAISVNPTFIIADEPTAGLDAIFTNQILDLILHLKQKFKLTTLLISHDWNAISYATDRVAVIYSGKIIETGLTKELIKNSIHPYTSLLIQSAKLEIDKVNDFKIESKFHYYGSEGCVYSNRCPLAEKNCFSTEPELVSIEKNRKVACHFAKEIYSDSNFIQKNLKTN